MENLSRCDVFILSSFRQKSLSPKLKFRDVANLNLIIRFAQTKRKPYLYRRCMKSQRVNVLADRWCGGIPSCTCVVNGFASISSFLESSFRNSLRDGFFQISVNRSYTISSRRREACFTNLSQDERGVRKAVSRTVHHIPVVSAL
ncbi:hypothetical protein AVEN_3800-1 [Araneus ventricosus]|uniref:Uncharacterized protein n=1 Tax=Araneus ventricosus TaxID=182803 RepID=A0A4Y2HE35_ARAVE|nr:hypothetical protein AVEN_3800-1 [Araneus ventricosus]